MPEIQIQAMACPFSNSELEQLQTQNTTAFEERYEYSLE